MSESVIVHLIAWNDAIIMNIVDENVENFVISNKLLT